MACFFKCPDNKQYAYLSHTFLQKDSLGYEYTKLCIFCNQECLEKFRELYTTEDENGNDYINEIKDDTRNTCPLLMIDLVRECKKLQLLLKKEASRLSTL
jgi:hypothetical protein